MRIICLEGLSKDLDEYTWQRAKSCLLMSTWKSNHIFWNSEHPSINDQFTSLKGALKFTSHITVFSVICVFGRLALSNLQSLRSCHRSVYTYTVPSSLYSMTEGRQVTDAPDVNIVSNIKIEIKI